MAYFMHLDGTEAYVVQHRDDIPADRLFNYDETDFNLFTFKFRVNGTGADAKAEAEQYIGGYGWRTSGEWAQHPLGAPYIEVIKPARVAR